MIKNQRIKILTIGLIGALGVIIGAFGAHYLKARISTASLASFQTGVNYHFYHTLAAFMVLILSKQHNRNLNKSFWLFIIGIICFSGSIYILTTKELHQSSITGFIGPITPIGGLLFILAWLSLCIDFWSLKEK